MLTFRYFLKFAASQRCLKSENTSNEMILCSLIIFFQIKFLVQDVFDFVRYRKNTKNLSSVFRNMKSFCWLATFFNCKKETKKKEKIKFIRFARKKNVENKFLSKVNNWLNKLFVTSAFWIFKKIYYQHAYFVYLNILLTNWDKFRS